MWGRTRRAVEVVPLQTRSDPSFGISDPGLAEYLGLSGNSSAGMTVTERTVLGLTAYWRAASIISGTIAGLPLKSYTDRAGKDRERVRTWVDDPGRLTPLSPTPFEWVELIVIHLMLHGNAFLLHLFNGAGVVVGAEVIHPSCVKVRLADDGSKIFEVRFKLPSGGVDVVPFTTLEMTHIPGMGTDGIMGLPPIEICQQALGGAMAGDRAAAKAFGNGLLVGGLVTPDEPLDEDVAKGVVAGLRAHLRGPEHAGDLAWVNAGIKVQPWSSTAEDAQFIESRQFAIAEVARLTGVPKVLLAEDGASTWGAGIAELNRGLARYTLSDFTTRIEQRVSRLLPAGTFCEFDYAGLLQGTPEVELAMLLDQVAGGLLTVDEARGIRNLAPLGAQAQESDLADAP